MKNYLDELRLQRAKMRSFHFSPVTQCLRCIFWCIIYHTDHVRLPSFNKALSDKVGLYIQVFLGICVFEK